MVCTVTGSTHAGMIAGFAALEEAGGRPRRVIGIDASATLDKTRDQVARIARNTAELIGLGRDLRDDEITVLEGWAGDLYGVPVQSTLDAIRLTGQLEGVIIDPVYEGKSMAGLIDLVRTGEIPRTRRCSTPTSAASRRSTPTPACSRRPSGSARRGRGSSYGDAMRRMAGATVVLGARALCGMRASFWCAVAGRGWLAVGPWVFAALLVALLVPATPADAAEPLGARCGRGRGAAAVAVVVVLPDGRLPIPPGGGLLVTPSYDGQAGRRRSRSSSTSPQHPGLAPNGRSSMHDDGWATDSYAGPGPLGHDPEVDSAWYGLKECATLAFDPEDRLVALCGDRTGPVLHVIDPDSMQPVETFDLPDRDGVRTSGHGRTSAAAPTSTWTPRTARSSRPPTGGSRDDLDSDGTATRSTRWTSPTSSRTTTAWSR